MSRWYLFPFTCAVLTAAVFFLYQQPFEPKLQEITSPIGMDIAARLINPPANKSTRYNFSQIDNNNPLANRKPLLGQWGEQGRVAEMFKGKRDGFFIECGALDGESISNTLLFEIQFGWQGLLIEAIPEAFAKLRNKNRRAYSINAALSKKAYPTIIQFEVLSQHALSGALDENGLSARQKGNRFAKNYPRSHVITVEALPIFSILAAIGNPIVDYFSLDIEGSEEGVLETIPWQQVDIRVLQVEYLHSNKTNILRIMDAAGYDNLTPKLNLKTDFIFVKRGQNIM